MERVSSIGPRDNNIVPLLYLIVFLCLVMSMMLFVKKVYMAIIILVKLFMKRPGRHPERQYIWKLMHKKDEILVQIPTYNETEVHLSLPSSFGVSWTSDRIIIQVINDSTDPVIKERNKEERNKEEEVMEDENERNQEEEIRTSEEKEDENERNQEEEIRTTEEKGRPKQGGDTLGERKSQAKRRKKAKVNQDDEGRKKRKQQCRWVRSCTAMGCVAIFTSALILVALANIRYVEEETVYLFPT